VRLVQRQHLAVRGLVQQVRVLVARLPGMRLGQGLRAKPVDPALAVPFTPAATLTDASIAPIAACALSAPSHSALTADSPRVPCAQGLASTTAAHAAHARTPSTKQPLARQPPSRGSGGR